MQKYLLDQREEESLICLNKKYEDFIEPSKVSKAADKLKDICLEKLPDQLKDFCQSGLDAAEENILWKNVVIMASKGFIALQELASKHTIDEKQIIKKMQKINKEVDTIEKIRQMKSYEIEKMVNSREIVSYVHMWIQSAPTGFAGIAGLPANIVLGTFIQFRSVQLIAMHYGYDVKGNSAELDYASKVLMLIMMKGEVTDADGLTETISKMMAQAELTSLRQALSKSTYEEMARNGGIQLIYTQIRAITNKAAATALNKAGEKNIENKVLVKILETMSKGMGKKVGAKSFPIISAALSVLIDTYQIKKVLEMANVIYAKRFLVDKEMRNHDIVDAESAENFVNIVDFEEALEELEK